MLGGLESQIEWSTGIRTWQSHDLAINHAPTLARDTSRSGLSIVSAEMEPHFIITGASPRFTSSDFGIFLA